MLFERLHSTGVHHVLRSVAATGDIAGKDLTLLLICKRLLWPGNHGYRQDFKYRPRGHFAILADGYAEK